MHSGRKHFISLQCNSIFGGFFGLEVMRSGRKYFYFIAMQYCIWRGGGRSNAYSNCLFKIVDNLLTKEKFKKINK